MRDVLESVRCPWQLLKLNFSRIRLRHSAFNPPHWTLLGKGSLEFQKGRCLALHRPNMDVGRLLAHERRDYPCRALNFRFQYPMLSAVFDKAYLERLVWTRRDVYLHHSGFV